MVRLLLTHLTHVQFVILQVLLVVYRPIVPTGRHHQQQQEQQQQGQHASSSSSKRLHPLQHNRQQQQQAEQQRLASVCRRQLATCAPQG
jgi:hypothetical protein